MWIKSNHTGNLINLNQCSHIWIRDKDATGNYELVTTNEENGYGYFTLVRSEYKEDLNRFQSKIEAKLGVVKFTDFT
jgi:hypothetical protein